jgi:hypothetical protein
MSINPAELTRLITQSRLPDEFKARLVPIAQVASDADREKIFHRVKNFDLRFLKIAQGRIKPKPEDMIVVNTKNSF